MKAELTNIELARIYGAYIGCEISHEGNAKAYFRGVSLDSEQYEIMYHNPFNGSKGKLFLMGFQLLLTPLSKITEEDAKNVFRLLEVSWRGYPLDRVMFIKAKSDKIFYKSALGGWSVEYDIEYLPNQAAAYLQSKGYSLPVYIPRLKKSIDLFEEGIAKEK
ncbi:hypothetical protein HN803_02675 [candidate division WWE3 bacterium]|nr:hypothetical protein [candidate division WWE3 bacterium]